MNMKKILFAVFLVLVLVGVSLGEQRYYIAPVLDRIDPEFGDQYKSSLLNDLIDTAQGDGFQEWHMSARSYSLCLVWANAATQAAIAANPDVITASPLFVDNADRIAKMGGIANMNAVKARLEAIGLNTEWLTGAETYRDVLRYVVKHFWLGQVVTGRPGLVSQDMIDLINAHLTTTVGQIPAQKRNAVKNWMQNRGLATGWIDNATTVRQVVHFILINLNIPSIPTLGDNF